MPSGRFRFGDFELDPGDRQLRRDGAPVELSSRYLDALALLVREQGRLVSKDRFMEEVWRGVPVTDEALTQCVRTLRRQLGDDAARPRFIETVPKHGYRFIAPVASSEAISADPVPVEGVAPSYGWRPFLLRGAAGAIGGAIAGLYGGLLYGFTASAQPLAPGVGALSVLLVLTCLTIVTGLVGGAGVGFGIAAAGFAPGRQWHWTMLGGAAGGLVVGALVKLVGIDAFTLLLGRPPGDITGAGEGVLLGGAVGLGAWLAMRPGQGRSISRRAAPAGLAGAVAGLAIVLLGGRMMAGSLALLAGQFPDSRLRLDPIGGLFGESGFGPVSQAVTGVLEGGLFGFCVVGAMVLAGRFSREVK